MSAVTDMGYDQSGHGQAKLPLGVGAIIGESFSILFRKFLTVMALSAIPLLVSLGISGALIGWQMVLGGGDPAAFSDAATDAGFWGKYGLAMLIQMAIYGITTALLVQLAYDAKLGQSRSLGAYFGPALGTAVPVAVLMIVTMFLVVLGSIALVLPGLWIYAVFAVTTPAVVIERAGFRGMGRSARLTKNYRWPILGALILVGLLTVALSFVTGFISALVSAPLASSSVGIVISVLVMALLQSVTLGLSSIAAALIYARLKEIKEGVSVDQLAAVFE